MILAFIVQQMRTNLVLILCIWQCVTYVLYRYLPKAQYDKMSALLAIIVRIKQG